MSSALVIQTSFIGDTILTTPLLSELAERGAVDVVVTPAGAELLKGHPAVRTAFVYDKRGADAGIMGLRRLARRLGSYDAAYLAQGSFRSAALARLAGIPVRVGLADSPGRMLLTARVPQARDRHQAERLWRLAFPDGNVPAVMPAPRLYPGDGERAAVDALLGGDDGPLIALAPGSVWATKRWPYFESLAAKLAGEGYRLVVIGGRDDAVLGEVIRARVASTIVAAGRLSLLASAELLRRARLVITNDSSPTHLASAMGTPTVAIFGPTIPGFGFGPLAPGSRVAQHDAMPCRPCHHHGPRRCPLGHWKCMTELSVSRVEEEVQRLVRS